MPRKASPGRPWTDEDLARLRELANKHDGYEIASLLDRTICAVRTKARELKVGRDPKGTCAPRFGFRRMADGGLAKHWSLEEDGRLYWLCETNNQREVAKKLGRSVCAVRSRCHLLKIRWHAGKRSLAQAAQELKVSDTTVLRWIRKLELEKKVLLVSNRRCITDEQLSELKKLRGWSASG